MSPSHWSMSRLFASEMAMVLTRPSPLTNTVLADASAKTVSARKYLWQLCTMAVTASRLSVLPPSFRPTRATTAPAAAAVAKAAAAAEIERELCVLGATAIEDRLQDAVGATPHRRGDRPSRDRLYHRRS